MFKMNKSDEKALVKCLNWADKKKIPTKFSRKRAMARFKFPAAKVFVLLSVDEETGDVWADLRCRGLYTSVPATLLKEELKDLYQDHLEYVSKTGKYLDDEET